MDCIEWIEGVSAQDPMYKGLSGVGVGLCSNQTGYKVCPCTHRALLNTRPTLHTWLHAHTLAKHPGVSIGNRGDGYLLAIHRHKTVFSAMAHTHQESKRKASTWQQGSFHCLYGQSSLHQTVTNRQAQLDKWYTQVTPWNQVLFRSPLLQQPKFCPTQFLDSCIKTEGRSGTISHDIMLQARQSIQQRA